MAAKVPIRAVFDGSTATGLAEFQSTEFIALAYGGLGASLSIGTAGQVLKVNSGADALEFGAVEAVLNIDGMTDGSGITIVDADKFAISDGGTEKYILASQIKTYVAGAGATAITALDIDGGTDIGAAIVDADLFIVDDGAGGTNRKTAASRIATYVGASAGAFSITNLDIDGGTDIGAAIVDADLFIIDDGAGGTNRKVAASRIKTYVHGTGAVDITTLDIDGGTDIGAAIVDADLFIVDDGAGGTNRKTAASRLKTYIEASAMAVTGNVTATGTVEPAGDTASGDNAAIGYTSAEGLILTGQGSTNDITIKNDADAAVISIPTGTTNVTIAGDLTISGDDLTMGTNTNTAVLVADGTNYNPVVPSGDVGLTNAGVFSIASGVIVNADVNASAAIVDTKLDTISTANKVGLAALDIDGGTDIGAAIVDADLFIVDDGAGGTNRKVAASRLKTYVEDATGEVPIANLNIDGGTDIGAAIVDADLFIIDDGAGGTNRKTAASRIATYVGAGAGAFSIANLDIDGGTDIGAAIVDADLFIIDDGAGGTNRKTAASRLKTYIEDAAGEVPIANLNIDGGTDIGAAIVDADLFIVDDGAGGTNRKTAASRLKTYIGGGGSYFLGGASGASGDTTNGLEDIFRVNSATVDNSCTIASSTNASASGPLTVSDGVTVTVAGVLIIL